MTLITDPAQRLAAAPAAPQPALAAWAANPAFAGLAALRPPAVVPPLGRAVRAALAGDSGRRNPNPDDGGEG